MTFDGNAWSSLAVVPGDAGPPALAVARGRLHLVRKLRGTHSWCAYDGAQWSAPRALAQCASKDDPALAQLGEHLVLTHVGETSSTVWMATYGEP